MPPSTQKEEYISRINRVMDYIQENLDRLMTLEQLASVACFSPFHFHRIFRAIVGETLAHFIQRVRVEKAASTLLVNPKASVTAIALDCGFGSSAAFARVFREAYGMSAIRTSTSRHGTMCSVPGCLTAGISRTTGPVLNCVSTTRKSIRRISILWISVFRLSLCKNVQ